MIVILTLVVGVLYAGGTFLILQRSLTRIVVGLGLLGHGANLLLLLAGGRGGEAPIVVDGSTASAPYADPLPQALALTAIVITFGVTAFLLALAFRSWQLRRSDIVEDDLEDRRIAQLSHQSDSGPRVDTGLEPEDIESEWELDERGPETRTT